MVRIVARPTWAKLIDFETTLAVAIQELADRREARKGAEAQARRPSGTPGRAVRGREE
jgi:hypothetical protein